MNFNKVIRGSKRAIYDEKTVHEVLDAGFLCHIAFQHNQQTMMIPTSYGRKDNTIYIHGSNKNFMMNEIANGQTICLSVTHLDGIVLARTLFNTSANYRSVVVFGKAEVIVEEEARMEALRIITENIIPNRWDEVSLGSETEIKATLVMKIEIESASCKIRDCGPNGDEAETDPIWSGHIPLEIQPKKPIFDSKFGEELPWSTSVKMYMEKFST